MKATKAILAIFVMLFASIMVGFAAGPAAGAAVFGISSLGVVPSGVLPMAVTPEIWTNYIVENLFKNNEFLLNSVDESQYVIGAGVVHIPQAGSPSRVQRNRQSLPATIKRRKDIDVTYVLDEFTTDPRFIPNIDKVELSYDKMDSCMSEDMSYLQQFLAEVMLYNWRPTAFIKTSGSSASATVGTGNRKSITVADFSAAKKALNKQNIPQDENRFVLISTDMMDQIITELRANANKVVVIYDEITGRIKQLEGFKIYERSTGLIASNATLTQNTTTKLWNWTSTDLVYTPEQIEEIYAVDDDGVPLGTSSFATTSCEIAIFWHKNAVARAMGKTEMFDDQGNPQYYGDIYSFLQRAGGRVRRATGNGVVGVIQVAP
jgi:hypothetical protein